MHQHFDPALSETDLKAGQYSQQKIFKKREQERKT